MNFGGWRERSWEPTGERPDIIVLYGDRRITRVHWGEKHKLRLDFVLAINITHPNDPKAAKRGPVFMHDKYVLVWDERSYYLDGYDDSTYWFDLEKPYMPYGEGYVAKFPYEMPKNSILFEGVMIDQNLWQEALKIIHDREGGMY